MEKNINHNQWRSTHPCQQEDHLLPPSSVGKIHQPQSIIWQDIQASGARMDIKGSGVIHPRCPSNIVEIIHMEIEQINIDNNNLEEIVISFPLSNPYQRPTLETIREEQAPHIIEKESSNISQIRSWHHQDHQQERRWQHQQTWHGWHYHPRQLTTARSRLSISTSHRSRTRMGQLHLTEATTSAII